MIFQFLFLPRKLKMAREKLHHLQELVKVVQQGGGPHLPIDDLEDLTLTLSEDQLDDTEYGESEEEGEESDNEEETVDEEEEEDDDDDDDKGEVSEGDEDEKSDISKSTTDPNFNVCSIYLILFSFHKWLCFLQFKLI